jgi:hypothetical protein
MRTPQGLVPARSWARACTRQGAKLAYTPRDRALQRGGAEAFVLAFLCSRRVTPACAHPRKGLPWGARRARTRTSATCRRAVHTLSQRALAWTVGTHNSSHDAWRPPYPNAPILGGYPRSPRARMLRQRRRPSGVHASRRCPCDVCVRYAPELSTPKQVRVLRRMAEKKHAPIRFCSTVRERAVHTIWRRGCASRLAMRNGLPRQVVSRRVCRVSVTCAGR